MAVAAVSLIVLSATSMVWGAARAVDFVSPLLSEDKWQAVALEGATLIAFTTLRSGRH